MGRDGAAISVTALADPKASGGPRVSFEDRVLSFSYEDTERGADKLTLSLRNDDLAMFAEDSLVGGQALEVAWGWPDDLAPPRRVVIKRISGGTTLNVEGHGLGIIHHRIERVRSWLGRTHSQVVAEVAQEMGYVGTSARITETTETYDAINQAGETDAAMLKRLARREGFEFWIDDAGLYWGPRRFDAAPRQVYRWGAPNGAADGILSWSVESNLVRRVGKVTVHGRDPITKRAITQAATGDTEDRVTLGDTKRVVDPETGRTTDEKINATDAVRAAGATNETKAKREASARYQRAERETVKLSLSVVGTPSMRAKATFQIDGLGTLLDGLYYATKVTHTIGPGGYVCIVEAVRDDLGKRSAAAESQAERARSQSGTRNEQGVKPPGEVERGVTFDPETGARTEGYYRGDAAVAADDPEARAAAARDFEATAKRYGQ